MPAPLQQAPGAGLDAFFEADAVAVVGASDDEWGQIIVAVVVPDGDSEPDPEELRAFVRERLRGSRTPDRVVVRAQLPTNATGKVLRRQIVDELDAKESL